MVMAEARRRDEWLRTGVVVAWLVNRNGWTQANSAVTPLDVIPAPFRPPQPPPREKTDEEREDESRRAWRMLDRMFGGC